MSEHQSWQPWQQPPSNQGDQHPAPEKQSNRGLWIGFAAATVTLILICCGGFYVWLADPFGGDDPSNGSNRIDGTPSATPSGQPTNTAPAITVAAPERLGNRAKLPDRTNTRMAADKEAAIKRDTRFTSVVVAYYGTADPRRNKVYLAAATMNTTMSKAAFEAAFDGMAKEAGLADMTNVSEVPAGPMGGFARCGMVTVEKVPTATCACADEGSFITVMWFNKQLSNQIKAELITIRAAVETKS